MDKYKILQKLFTRNNVKQEINRLIHGILHKKIN